MAGGRFLRKQKKELGTSDSGSFGQIPHEATSPAPAENVTAALAAGGEDIVRGNSNKQSLTPAGAATVLKTGKKLAHLGGVDKIVSSSAKRATESAAELQAADPSSPPIESSSGLESQALGNLEGEVKTPQVKKLLSDLVRKSPNSKIPGQGELSSRPSESFNEFKQRALGSVRGLMEQLADSPQSRIAVPDHSQVTKLVEAWIAAGHPDDLGIESSKMLSEKKILPGAVTRLYPDENGNWKMSNFNLNSSELPEGSIYFVEHGQTSSTSAKNDQISSGQKSRAQIIKYLRSMDPGRAMAEAKRAVAAGTLTDQDISDAIDEAAPSAKSAEALPSHHLLAAASMAPESRRAEFHPLLQSRFKDLSSLHPDAQRALSSHLSKLVR